MSKKIRIDKRRKDIHLPIRTQHSLHDTVAEAKTEVKRLRSLDDGWHYWVEHGTPGV